MMHLLKKSAKEKIIHLFDFHFSQFITKTNDTMMLVSACISYEHRNGHTCLPITYFEKNNFFSNVNKTLTKNIIKILSKKNDWILKISQHKSVGNGSYPTPLVLFKEKIYLYKIWTSEENILKRLYENNNKKISHINCNQIINYLFRKKQNMQTIAIALALINNITFIIGGPGTGKTTTILKIIFAIIKTTHVAIKIQLSAFTGKAVIRLNKLLRDNFFKKNLNKIEQNYLPSTAVTIHELLGIQKISQKSFFHKKNKLNLDVLIIDEASMINIFMMENIFLATEKTTKIIFIGDKNQLPPIESSCILQDICYYSNHGYSPKMIDHLQKITNNKLLHKINTYKSRFISDKICELKKNYRFSEHSEINILSNAICDKNINILQRACNNTLKNVFFYEIHSFLEYNNMIDKIVINNTNYWKKIHKKSTFQEIIHTFQMYQVLCIVRDGCFGVNMINKNIEEKMKYNKMIKNINQDNTEWYIGRPIIITKNNKYLDLSNGDIGITNLNNHGFFQVAFLKQNNIIQNIPITVLSHYESAWAMTVHKAQGSEFFNVALILPNVLLPILNKNMIYTGITRARNILSIFSTKKMFLSSILNDQKKQNSLLDRLNSL
ncbi:MAG: exodeoxyribonuclease V subunit alpha [Buchnera aphidicola (Pentalonia nigronervosa)]|uniref:RecBCD enzyme subunit RecD n=1 Tax=Buchnera aphidicola (Pentalonia nigronervosa) TaxID=1309793 RepID=A0A7H1B044_9GAMM|nr:MAG: exodeoxyribonuclease V subunit alpha [Buchnera aphidicola (Pentalonia nigronervosa)]